MATTSGIRRQTIRASAATAAPGTTTVVVGSLDRIRQAMFFLDLTAAATDAADTLNVYLQKSPDGGTTWTDFVHFTEMLGNGGAKNFLAEWSDTPTPETELGAVQDGAIAAGVVQGGCIGDRIRIKEVMVDADADASFTWSLVMLVTEDYGGL